MNKESVIVYWIYPTSTMITEFGYRLCEAVDLFQACCDKCLVVCNLLVFIGGWFVLGVRAKDKISIYCMLSLQAFKF